MTETVGIVVATFGDESWTRLAEDRAIPSAHRQTRPADHVIHAHGDTLHQARNLGAQEVATDFVIFLDADDELDERYVESMMAGTGDLRQPSTLGVHPDGREDPCPVLIKAKPLLEGNYLVIGSMARRSLFQDVGGFHPDRAWEDWSVWVRMWLRGAVITACPDAIYRVHVNANGRNAVPAAEAQALYAQMRAGFEAYR